MGYVYKVVDVREGGRLTADKLQNVLNLHAQQGWRLRAIVESEARKGIAVREALMLTFERPA